MRRSKYAFVFLLSVFLLIGLSESNVQAVPMEITYGTYTTAAGVTTSVTGMIEWNQPVGYHNQLALIIGPDIYLNGFHPIHTDYTGDNGQNVRHFSENISVSPSSYWFRSSFSYPYPVINGIGIDCYGSAYFVGANFNTSDYRPDANRASSVNILAYTGVEMTVVLIDAATNSYDVINLRAANVPEPGTMLLLGFGLIGLAGMRKRFRH